MHRWFIHIDADAFFASVEQCIHRELRGKPVVTGRDGSIAVAMSYEAKALGVERATPIHILRKEFPSVSIVVSDYYTYRIFSDRMLAIIQTYLPQVVRNSIDECSGEIIGMITQQEVQQLANDIQQALQTKLSCSFSLGISRSPLLAKLASGMHKPSGMTIIDPLVDYSYQQLPIAKVSGLGSKTCERLGKLGIIFVKDFIEKYPRIKKDFSINLEDIYYEVQGIPKLRKQKKAHQQSMNRARSFTVTKSREAVYGQLIVNSEHLLRKMRTQKLGCTRIQVALKDTYRVIHHEQQTLHTLSFDTNTIMTYVTKLFNQLFIPGEGYRYVSVTFFGLQSQEYMQADLFGESHHEEQQSKLYMSLDSLNTRFGKQVISYGSTMTLPRSFGTSEYQAKHLMTQAYHLLPGESVYQRLRYPYMGKI